jgi:ABC-type protease/lipase transport system fused ATPase/permease subunit
VKNECGSRKLKKLFSVKESMSVIGYNSNTDEYWESLFEIVIFSCEMWFCWLQIWTDEYKSNTKKTENIA